MFKRRAPPAAHRIVKPSTTNEVLKPLRSLAPKEEDDDEGVECFDDDDNEDEVDLRIKRAREAQEALRLAASTSALGGRGLAASTAGVPLGLKAGRTSKGVGNSGNNDLTTAGVDATDDVAVVPGLLDQSFRQQADKAGGGNGGIDEHLNRYLNERIRDEREESRKKAAAAAAAAEPLSLDAELGRQLYEIPEHLRIEELNVDHKDQTCWVSGLAEVPLPVESRIQKIEEMEALRRRELEAALLQKKGGSRKARAKL